MEWHTKYLLTKEKAELASRAAEHRITSTICYFTKIEGVKSKDQQCTISASTLHGQVFLGTCYKMTNSNENPEVT